MLEKLKLVFDLLGLAWLNRSLLEHVGALGSDFEAILKSLIGLVQSRCWDFKRVLSKWLGLAQSWLEKVKDCLDHLQIIN